MAYNYTQGLMPDLAGSLLQGIQAGQNIQMNQERLGMLRDQKQAAIDQKKREAEFNQDLFGIYGSNDYKAIDSVLKKYPEFDAQVKARVQELGIRSKEQAANVFSKIDYMLGNGDKENASRFAREQAEAVKNFDPNASAMWAEMAQDIDESEDLEDERSTIGLYASRTVGEEFFKGRKQAAEIAKTEGESQEVSERASKAKMDRLKEEQAINSLPDDVQKIYRSSDKDLSTANRELTQMSGIIENLTGVTPSEFGGGFFDSWKRWSQVKLSGKEWGPGGEKRSLLRTQLAQLRLTEAMKAKAAGALSEQEMIELLKTTPDENADIDVYKSWIGARVKLIQALRAGESVRKAYLSKFKTDMPTGKKSFIEVSGKKVPVGPDQGPNEIISKIGKKLHEFAPEFGGGLSLEESPEVAPEVKSAYEQKLQQYGIKK